MQKILVIVGPTASGKSALAWELAQKYNGEIISADSRQVFRGMDIGTGKEKFPQRLIDVADPIDDYNVSHFAADAKKAIEDIAGHGKLPIVVGGSGFWIDALVFGHELPDVKPMTELRAELEQKSWQELFAQLEKLDPERAKHIDRHNKRRLTRALEVILTTGEVIPQLKSTPQYDALWIGIKISKEDLDKRIEKRLHERLEHGMIEEVKKLHAPLSDGGFAVSWGRLDNFGLEYRYIAKYLQEEITREEMQEQLLQAIRQFAKRQMTWFKRNKTIQWVSLEACVPESQKLLQDWLSLS